MELLELLAQRFRRHRDHPLLQAERYDAVHGGKHHPRQQGDVEGIAFGQQPNQGLMHQLEGLHDHLQDVFRKRPVVLHPVLEQRPQKVRVHRGELQIGRGQALQLPDRVIGGDGDQPGGQRLDSLTVHGEDQAVEVAKLIIDASDGALGGVGDITNLQ